MLTIEPTAAFKREVQRLAQRGRNVLKMFTPIAMLLNNQPFPPEYDDHPLKGKWLGFREFHVEPDWLIIYQVDNTSLIVARTGNHSDLFKS